MNKNQRKWIIISIVIIIILALGLGLGLGLGLKKKDTVSLFELFESLPELIEKYNEFYKKNNFNIAPTVWNVDNVKDSFNKLQFRGDNQYVWQRGDSEDMYINYYNKIKNFDEDKLLEKTKEDGSYGCKTYNTDNTLISRDLLDSITEIYFLSRAQFFKDDQLKNFFPDLNKLTILDIGAGYGRLCKRFTDCFPESNYLVTDAIPQSTYFSKIYLKNNNRVINLFDLVEKTKSLKIDVAINIHSFPECNINDVEWWVKFIHSKKIKIYFLCSK